jgi:Protein of unknown function (DUF4239)
MSRWLHELPVVWIAAVVLIAIAALVAATHAVAMRLATGDRGEAMRSLSPGLLPPLGIVFALIVGFLAAGVWGDSDKARDAVSSEASALRAVVLLSDQLPPQDASRLRLLVRRQIQDAVHQEWPAMRRQHADLAAIPAPLVQAQTLVLSFRPASPGAVDAQRELVTSLQQALDARRQRIIVSDSHVNTVKWLGLLVLAAVMLIAIACVHSPNRRSALLAMSLFGAAVVAVVVMLVAQDEPFTGHLGQTPDLLEQVLPGA